MLTFKFASHLDKFLIIFGTIFSILSGILNSLVVITYAKVTVGMIAYAKKVDKGLNEEEKNEANEKLMHGATVFVLENSGLGILSFCCGYIAMGSFSYGALRQIYRIRLLYLKQLLNQDISWYDTNQTTDFVSRMTTDLKKIESILGEKMSVLIHLITRSLSCLLIVLLTGWEIALVCLSPFLLSTILIIFLSKISVKLTKKELNAYANAASIAEEAFTLIKTVAAFGGEKKEKEMYDKYLLLAKNNNTRRSLFFASYNISITFFIFVSWSLCFWYGLFLCARSEKDVEDATGQLLIVYLCITRISQCFTECYSYLETFLNARGAAESIFKVINSVPAINAQKRKGKKLNEVKGYITFSNVSFSYPSRPDIQVLNDVNFRIKAGETVAIVGDSGSGKSTLIQLVQRFYDPDVGDIYLDETNLKDLDLNWLRNRIGVVSQEPVLFETTIAENIKLGNPSASQEDIENAARKAYAHTFVIKFPQGYHTLVGERGVQLSGGQKQRIAIARALIRKPLILLLDEATSALDIKSEVLVQMSMDIASMHCTTIIVAHRLSTVRKADRILVLANGKIQEDGTHATLMKAKGIYFHLLNSQAKSEESMKFGPDLGNHENQDVASKMEDAVASNENSFKTEEYSSHLGYIIELAYPQRYYILFGCLTSIIGGLSLSVSSIIFGAIIEVLASEETNFLHDNFNKYALFFLILGICTAIVASLKAYLLSHSSEMLSLRLRSQTFEAILSQNMSWFDRKENAVGSLCAHLSGEAVHLQGAFGSIVGVVLYALFVNIFSLITGFCFEWRMSLVILCFFPVLVIALYCTRYLIVKESQDCYQSIGASSKVANEAISSIRTVTSLGCENIFYQRYKSELTPYFQAVKKKIHAQALITGILRNFLCVAYTVPIYFGSLLMKNENINLSSVFTPMQAMVTGFWFVGNVMSLFPDLVKALASVRRIFQFLNCLSSIQLGNDHYIKKLEQGNIKYEKVQFTYPSRPLDQVLKDVNVSIFQGKTVALVGPTGCGKSTIIQLLVRFYQANGGKISVDGENIKHMNLRSLRSYLGIVFQEPNLFNRTIAENIGYGDNEREVSMEEIVDAAKRANIHGFISELPLGYETNLGEKGIQLSGGQKQRMAIARALVRNPKVLLLDEATSALDANNEKIVQQALDDVKLGRSCIIIAHRLSTIQNADIICAINYGKIIEMGTHSELMAKKGFYYNLYSLHSN